MCRTARCEGRPSNVPEYVVRMLSRSERVRSQITPGQRWLADNNGTKCLRRLLLAFVTSFHEWQLLHVTICSSRTCICPQPYLMRCRPAASPRCRKHLSACGMSSEIVRIIETPSPAIPRPPNMSLSKEQQGGGCRFSESGTRERLLPTAAWIDGVARRGRLTDVLMQVIRRTELYGLPYRSLVCVVGCSQDKDYYIWGSMEEHMHCVSRMVARGGTVLSTSDPVRVRVVHCQGLTMSLDSRLTQENHKTQQEAS